MKGTGAVKNLLQSLISVFLALVIGWIFLLLAGYDAKLGFSALVDASFATPKAFGNMLNKTTPLLLCGTAIAISFRGSIYNLGCEGQFLAGATLSTLVGIYATNLPGYVLIPLMTLCGAVGGAIWGSIAGVLKAKLQISELISTIMLNYIMQRFVSYLIRGPIFDKTAGNAQSYRIAEQAFLADIVPGTKLHASYFVAVVIAVIIFIYLFKTYAGYEIRAVGLNSRAAQTAGINVPRTIISTMCVSGALAGIAGSFEIMGTAHYLLDTLSAGYGWTGIAVSMLASNNPLGILLSSLLFGFLNQGATAMQRVADISSVFVDVLQGLIILSVVIAVTLSSSARTAKKKEK